MLRINQNNSAAGAKSYYTTADYYSEGQELDGIWRGEGARRLGLFGKVEKEQWEALCDNLNPGTGERLTQRTKADRRVGYDFTFSVPKSVSLLYSLTNDERLLDSFRESVTETMQEIEAEMKTRVRKDGLDEDRISGNMVWGEYVHTTSRPVDGVPDPGLHCHCFAFNTTWDKKEERWKAGQFADIKRDAPYFQAVFQSKFAHRLTEMGIGVERKKGGWDLAGIDQATVRKFSRRTAEIEKMAVLLGIKDPSKKGELGAKTRKGKDSVLTYEQLRSHWQSRLTPEEGATFKNLADRIGSPAIPLIPEAAGKAVESAIGHCFERKSVVPERVLLAESLKRSLGAATRESVEDAFQRQDLITADRKGRRMVTTRAILAEERKMLDFARNGRGTQERLGKSKHVFKREWLNDDQKRATLHILNSRDRVILLRGAAGVGKTTMIKEAVEAIVENGKEVFTFAPSADASRGTLRDDGFKDADTVASLLLDEKLHEKIKGQVIWIDEAGLLGSVTTAKVFDLAQKLDARVVLSGDPRQHASVERGSPLRLLETEAGLVPAEIKEIQRQSGDYKKAIEHLSEGRTEAGFLELDRLKSIRVVPLKELDEALAAEYVSTIASGKEALALCPTHMGGDQLTAAIRHQLKKRGMLGKDEREFTTLKSLKLTEADRADAINYAPGHVIEYHQNAKGHRKGERITVGEEPLPLEQAARFEAYHTKNISVAVGDTIRITKNGQTADQKHRLNNGTQYRVKGFDNSGNLILGNGWTVSKDFGHFTHGWVLTSHASQGKTIKHKVFISQPAHAFPASSQEQFYVSTSRAREEVMIFTDDKEALLSAVSKSDERLSATEMVLCRGLDEQRDILRRQELIAGVYIPQVSGKEREKELVHER